MTYGALVFCLDHMSFDAVARRRSMESGQMAPWSRTCGASSHRLNGSPCRPKGRLVLWPVVCPMPAGGSAVKGRQRGGWLPVAERASPLTALQAAGTKPGAKRRAQIRTAADRGTPMPRCQGGCHLAGASLKSSTNTSLWSGEGMRPGGKNKKTCRDLCRSIAQAPVSVGSGSAARGRSACRRLPCGRGSPSPPCRGPWGLRGGSARRRRRWRASLCRVRLRPR